MLRTLSKTGDRLLLPGVHAKQAEDEEVLIVGVREHEITVAPLAYDHIPPMADIPTYATNLTRNVIFDSEMNALPGHSAPPGPPRPTRKYCQGLNPDPSPDLYFPNTRPETSALQKRPCALPEYSVLVKTQNLAVQCQKQISSNNHPQQVDVEAGTCLGK